MFYEYWLDMIQFFEEIGERFINFASQLLVEMVDQGTECRIGDLNINEIVKKARKEV